MAGIATAREILEKALKAAEKSMQYFEWMENMEEEGSEIEHSYWCNVREYDGMASAYLDCYKMLTGREVVNVLPAIREEYIGQFTLI